MSGPSRWRVGCARAISEVNLFPEFHEIGQRRRRGVVMTVVYIVTLMVGCASILGFLASRATTEVQQVLSPSLAQLRAIQASGITPSCSCNSASIPYSAFLTVNFTQDGLCLWVDEAIGLCALLDGACEANEVEFTGVGTGGVTNYLKGGTLLCQLAAETTANVISSFLASHFPTPNLIEQASLDSISNQTVSTLRQSAITAFVSPVNGARAVAAVSRPVFWSQLAASLIVTAQGPSANAALFGGNSTGDFSIANSTDQLRLGGNDTLVGVAGPVYGPTVSAVNGYQTELARAAGDATPACTCASDPGCSLPFTQEPFASFGVSFFCDQYDSLRGIPSALILSPAAMVTLGLPAEAAAIVPSTYFTFPTIGAALDGGCLRTWSYTLDYGAYFASCQPSTCTWVINSRPTALQAISILAGVLGGLSVLLRSAIGAVGSLLFRATICRRLIGESDDPSNHDVELSLPHSASSTSPTAV
jgi:hypothetical protein